MPFEFLAEKQQVSYPFEDLEDEGLKKLFVDAFTVFSGPNIALDKRVKLVHFDPTGVKRVRLEFEDATLLADVTDGVDDVVLSVRALGEYTLYEWSKVAPLTTWFTGLELLVRFVVHTETSVATVYPLVLTDAIMLSTLVNPRPKHVRKIAVRQPGEDCCTFDALPAFAEGFIRFDAGPNMELNRVAQSVPISLGLEEDSPVRTREPIVFEVVPGKGNPVSDCPEEELVIRTIHGAGADDFGNFNLAGNDCLWLERPLDGGGFVPVHPNTDYEANVVPNTLKIHDNCKPCCDCSDYGAAYQALSDMWEKAKLVAAKIAQLKAKYEELRQLWLDSSVCNQGPLRVRVRAFARPDFMLAVSGVVVNRSQFDVAGVTMTFSVVPSGTYLTGSGQLERDNLPMQHIDGTVIPLGTLVPSEQARFSFDMRWFTPGRVGLSVMVTLTAGAVSDSDTVTLLKPGEKE